MKLLNPIAVRLTAPQDRWLQQRADAQGHGKKVLILRMLIDRDMKRRPSDK